MAQITISQAFDLALQHHQSGRLNEAELLYRQILAQQPEHEGALHYLGVIAHQVGRNDIAVDLIRQALARNPHWPEAYNNLGEVFRAQCELDQAIAAFRQAIALKPLYPAAYYNMGNALLEKGQVDETIAAYRQAIAFKPDYHEAYNNLGAALTTQGQLDEAIATYHQCQALKPDYAEAYSNLAVALKDTGRLDEGIAVCRQAIALKPDYVAAHSNLVYSLHFHPGYDAQAIYHEHCLWNQQHVGPLTPHLQPHANNRDPERRLRLGYVSADLREHVVGMFLLPLLQNHDPQHVEVFAYAQVSAPDAMSQRLRQHTHVWRRLVGLSDAQAADLVRQDGIDILVDLGLHTAGNRLMVFAHKPAPVQATYLGYAGSSGLSTMDYRLSDPYLDPHGDEDAIYSEQTIRLPETYWCYQPMVEVAVQPVPPSLERGCITFGCLNNFCKVNEPLLDLWARILAAVPQSRLLLYTHPGSHRQNVLEQMQRAGIAPQRIDFAEKAGITAYFQRYHGIDIALDTHPFGGGTTTCDALWMGVPVVSLAGKTAVGRGGLSILSNLGLPKLVAKTPEEYVRLAVALANDLPRLQALRATLRPRMQASPLMDAPRFARNVEAAYRQMWRKCCAAGSP